MSRDQADQVALAVDQPRKPAFPWPFANRTPSYVPRKFTPQPIDPPTVWARPISFDFDRLWPYYFAAGLTLCGVAFVVCGFWWRG